MTQFQRSNRLRIAVFLTTAIAASLPFAQPRLQAAESSASISLVQKYTQRHEQFATEMQDVATTCRLNGYEKAALQIDQRSPQLDQLQVDVDQLPEEVQPELPPGLPAVELGWRTRIRDVETRYAKDLYDLAQKFIRLKQPTWAFHLVREAAFHDPDHKQARAALGFVRYEDRWVTPFTAQMLRKGSVWSEQFGWLPKSHLERYERGERFCRNNWIPAIQEEAIRSDFSQAWEIPSDHFVVKTNHSLERGVELSVALEHFHRFFVREFADFFNTPQQMQKLLESGTRTGSTRKHEVHYFRSRDEFITRLKARQPNIEVSNGIYMPKDRIAYFYFDPERIASNNETLFHEVTHQLLSEGGRIVVPDVGERANFWIIEGFACYMESYHRDENGRTTLGDVAHPRMHWARVVATEARHIPIQEFTEMGRERFQAGDTATLRLNYAQAAGLTHFFLHYNSGAYRDALLAHLSLLYSPDARTRDRATTLNVLTSTTFPQLDQQYLHYLQQTADSVGAPLDRSQTPAAP